MARAIAIQIEQGTLTADGIKNAAWICDVQLDEKQAENLVRSVNRLQGELEALRAVELDADTPPSTHFATVDNAYAQNLSTPKLQDFRTVHLHRAPQKQLPESEVDIAFASINQLGHWLQNRKISSVELTELFLSRLALFGPSLNCVVTLTEDLAMRQARRADAEIASRRFRGPLHGIPWGAKDLIAVNGYPTTWGAEAFKSQVRAETATVAQRLADAGCVLVAKLTLGAFAMGDTWFGGKTLNPWNLEQGSSGSSAGSAAATSAGLVPFALGSETLGSIISPSRRCGTTGFRPTFGRVSRAGCMPLAWSFDKIGPIARSVEDCAIVFSVIHGTDGLDPTVCDHAFAWPERTSLSGYRIGYTGNREDRADLDLLQELGATITPIELPTEFPLRAITTMLDVESASMFYDVWKDGTEEGLFLWAKIWQTASFVPAIDYVRASRIRTLVMQKTEQLMGSVDAIVNADDLTLTNLTGHPSITIPYRKPTETVQAGKQIDQAATDETRSRDETPLNSTNTPTSAPMSTPVAPGSLLFTGRLNQDARLLTIADIFQRAKGDHTLYPPGFHRGRPLEPEAKE